MTIDHGGRAGMASKLRWLVPAFSATLLLSLVAHGSHCNSIAEAPSSTLAPVEVTNETAPAVTGAAGRTAAPVANVAATPAGAAGSAAAPVLFDDIGSLGSSKSGFGGLGLRDRGGVAPAPTAPAE